MSDDSDNENNQSRRRRSPRKLKKTNYKKYLDIYQRGTSYRKNCRDKKRKRNKQCNEANVPPIKKPRTSSSKAKKRSILTENTNTINVPMTSIMNTDNSMDVTNQTNGNYGMFVDGNEVNQAPNVELLHAQYVHEMQVLQAQHAMEIQQIKKDYCKPRKTSSNGHAHTRKRVNTTHFKQKEKQNQTVLAQNDELLGIITDYMNENDDIHIDKLLTKCLSVKLIYILF
eukprot:494070_1